MTSEDKEVQLTNAVSNVESTAFWTTMYRYRAGTETQLFDSSFDKAIIDACIPQKKVDEFFETHKEAYQLVGLRTIEIDNQLLQATTIASPATRQVVILGSGLDSRAWRLDWPEGVHLIEVDTGSVETIKTTVFQDFPLKAAKRSFIKCNVTDTVNLRLGLSINGHDPLEPTVWVLEGLVGYLRRDESKKLFECLFALSAPKSRVIVTCPPSPNDKKRFEKDGGRMYHSTTESPKYTLNRLQSTGWVGKVLSGDDINAKYGSHVPHMQPMIIAHKPELHVRSGWRPWVTAGMHLVASLPFRAIGSMVRRYSAAAAWASANPEAAKKLAAASAGVVVTGIAGAVLAKRLKKKKK